MSHRRPVAAQTTAYGLIVPVGGNKAMQDAIIGTVMAIGEDVKLPLVSGDVVIFSKCGPKLILIDEYHPSRVVVFDFLEHRDIWAPVTGASVADITSTVAGDQSKPGNIA